MKDRRGQIHQAYLGHYDEEGSTPASGGHAPAADVAGSIGPAPTPIVSEVASKPTPMAEAPDMTPSPASSAPSAAASQGEMMPDMAGDNYDGSPSGAAASNPGQASTAVDASIVPTAEAPAMAPASGGPAAPAAAPVSTGGGAPANSYAGDDMGWDAAAFAEAGGYDAVLIGSMPPGICPNSGDGQDIFVFIDELNVDIVDNTLVQNTEITIIADDGGVIEIDEFTAITTQESVVSTSGDSALPQPDSAEFLPNEEPAIESDIAMA